MRIQIYNTKQQWVGDIDTGEQSYYSQRDAKKGQVFHHFGNAIALDVSILKQLITKKIKFICILVSNFENKPSHYWITTLEFFINNSERFNYDKRNEYGQSYTGYGEQRRMPMQFWRKAYSQEDISRVINEHQIVLKDFLG